MAIHVKVTIRNDDLDANECQSVANLLQNILIFQHYKGFPSDTVKNFGEIMRSADGEYTIPSNTLAMIENYKVEIDEENETEAQFVFDLYKMQNPDEAFGTVKLKMDTLHVEVATENIDDCLLPELAKRLKKFIKQHHQWKMPRDTVKKVGDKMRSISDEYEIAVEDATLFAQVDNYLLETDAKHYNLHAMHFVFHFYQTNKREMEYANFNAELDAAGDDAEHVPSFGHWLLPSQAFMNLWENLYYEQDVKQKLFKYMMTALKFGQCNVDSKIIDCNRLLLLHGPPGGGKTSLCKALAQKLAIRNKHSYKHTHLIEINSHSLFSKWFSESGKLVMRLFAEIREIIADTNNLVCVLIDEVESLAYARDNMSGQEPKDAMRVVNALLTQLDSLKAHSNVFIMSTSNMANAIDDAFVDRADIKQYIGMPNVVASQNILRSMLHEMLRADLLLGNKQSVSISEEAINFIAQCTFDAQLSGRALRKLPFLAYLNFCQEKPSIATFLDAMCDVAQKQQIEAKAARIKQKL